MKKLTKILITAAVSVLAGILAVLFSNMGVISHASARAAADDRPFLKTTIADSSSRYTLVFNDTASGNRGQYISRLLLEILPESEKAADLVFTVCMAGEKDGCEYEKSADLSRTVLHDVNPIYVGTEVLSLNMENVISVTVEGNGGTRFHIGAVTIDNSFRWNRRMFLFGLVIGLAICLAAVPALLSVFALARTEKPEEFLNGKKAAKAITRSYLILAVLFGTLLAVILPVNKVGYDEETHLQAVLQMAAFPAGQLHVSDAIINQVSVTAYNDPEAQPAGDLEQDQYAEKLSELSDYKNGANSNRFYVMANRMPAYLPMAFAMKVCKGLSLPWTVILVIVRITNVLVFTALMYASLRVLPRGHALLALIGLFPLNLFLAATVSYDPFITGCMCLGLSLLFRILDDAENGRTLSFGKALLMLLFLLLACLVKAVYAPVILAAFLLPGTAFRSKKQRILYYVSVVMAFLLTVLLFIVPTLAAPSDTGDTRGGEAVSEGSQLGYIMENPFRYAKLLLTSMASRIREYCMGPDCSTFMGHLVTPFDAFKGYWIPYFIPIPLMQFFGGYRAFCEKKAGKKLFLSLRQRLWVLILCFGAACLTWTAMYVAFTPAGFGAILGVQGRYFVPLLFPMYFVLFADGPAQMQPEGNPFVARTEQICYYVMIGMLVLMTALSLWTCVVKPYCL